MSVPISRDNFSRRYAVVADTRRQWSDEEKQSIVAEASRPDVNISAVARRHGIKPSLLFRWRRLAREAETGTTAPAFMPITLALPSVCTGSAVPEASPAVGSSISETRPEPKQMRHDDRIEIELGNGRLVRVGAGVDAAVLKRIVDVLDRPRSNSEAVDGRPGR
jgi:transposase